MPVFGPQPVLALRYDGMAVGEFVNRPVQINALDNFAVVLPEVSPSLDKIAHKIPDHNFGIIPRQVQVGEKIHASI